MIVTIDGCNWLFDLKTMNFDYNIQNNYLILYFHLHFVYQRKYTCCQLYFEYKEGTLIVTLI